MITPEELTTLRRKHDLTQLEAAMLVHGSVRMWGQFESGEALKHTKRKLNNYKARTELFIYKIKEL